MFIKWKKKTAGKLQRAGLENPERHQSRSLLDGILEAIIQHNEYFIYYHNLMTIVKDTYGHFASNLFSSLIQAL